MQKSRESVLFYLFLLLLAGVLLFNLFTSPAMYRAKFTELEKPSTVTEPVTVPVTTEAETTFAAEAASSVPGKVNINTATAEELMTLKGIGEVKARKIVEDREKNGNFSSTQDLLRVNGIGEKTLEKILENITA